MPHDGWAVHNDQTSVAKSQRKYAYIQQHLDKFHPRGHNELLVSSQRWAGMDRQTYLIRIVTSFKRAKRAVDSIDPVVKAGSYALYEYVHMTK